jgi:hypothetical protein
MHKHRDALVLGSGKPNRFLFNTQFRWLESPVDYALATALRLRGHDVAMVACGGLPLYCEQALHYTTQRPSCESCFQNVTNDFKRFDLPFVTVKSAITPADMKMADDMSENSTVAELVDLCVSDIPIGRICWFNLLKYYFAYPFEIAGAREVIYRKILHSCILLVLAKERIFNQYQPDMIVTANGKMMQWAPFIHMAKNYGKSYVTWEEARWGKTLVAVNDIAHERRIDPVWEGESKKPLLALSRQKILDYFTLWEKGHNTPYPYYDETVEKDVDEIKRTLNLRPNTPVVSLFSNTVIDSAVMGIDSAFESIFDWLFKVIEYLSYVPIQRRLRSQPNWIGSSTIHRSVTRFEPVAHPCPPM